MVGAGPTGLLLAGDLAHAGLRTVHLEKRQDESNLIRAFAVHARTLEHLDARGLADPLVETGHVERLLLDRALDGGAELRRGATVTGLLQHDDHVRVAYASADTGGGRGDRAVRRRHRRPPLDGS